MADLSTRAESARPVPLGIRAVEHGFIVSTLDPGAPFIEGRQWAFQTPAALSAFVLDWAGGLAHAAEVQKTENARWLQTFIDVGEYAETALEPSDLFPALVRLKTRFPDLGRTVDCRFRARRSDGGLIKSGETTRFAEFVVMLARELPGVLTADQIMQLVG